MQKDSHQLTPEEQKQVLNLIKAGEVIPKDLLYKMAPDDEDVFLFWNGRSEEVTNAVLPFHSIEQIDEPRQEDKEQLGLLATDARGRQKSGWTNKLIWGDNKLILSSLVNGPMREEIEKEGGLKLIYIDPPFAVGADFSFTIEVGDEEVTKQQSVLEEIAYRDTWQRGLSSYLTMMYERLKLMHQLLADDGSIYVHCDYRVNSHLRLMLDDVFGKETLVNEIVWKKYSGVKNQSSKKFTTQTDTIFLYSNLNQHIFNQPFREMTEKYVKDEYKYVDEEGRKYGLLRGRGYQQRGEPTRRYLDEMKGSPVTTLWDDENLQLNTSSSERLGYETQKPETLLERIIKTSSDGGDLVADFFCGSGTTGAAAEKLGRKWIMADLGRFAIHTSRKRMIGVQRELKSEGKPYRAFEILNLGKYERRYFFNVNPELPEDQQKKQQQQKHQQYVSLILEAYRAQAIDDYRTFHGKRGDRFVCVGPVDFPVTKAVIDEILSECREKTVTKVDVLGFDFEMGLLPYIEEEMKQQGVNLRLKNIPREVFDKQAVEKGQVKFYDVPYLEVQPIVDGHKVSVKLTDFVTNYTQDDIEDIEKALRNGSSKVAIESGQIVKIEKDDKGIVRREILTKKWSDWIDYWAVDFDYQSKKEIIRIGKNSEEKEVWTGNYIFENEWQTFRTKRNRNLELESIQHDYQKSGPHKIAIRVVDILGQDTLQVVKINPT
jgi:DNA modification methylase